MENNSYTVSINKECCQYHQTQNVGFFKCPNCQEQCCKDWGEAGDVYECDCNAIITFEE